MPSRASWPRTDARTSADARRTFETVPGRQAVRVARLGYGPPVVLLHGYPDNLQIWCELAPRLADRFGVIAFDWPGMGDSDAWPGGRYPIHMADRLRVLLDAWGISRGAWWAWTWADSRPSTSPPGTRSGRATWWS